MSSTVSRAGNIPRKVQTAPERAGQRNQERAELRSRLKALAK